MAALRSGLLIALMTFVLVGSSSAENYKVITLPSGKQIKALGIVRLAFTKGTPALMFKYQTDLPIDDIPALEKESDEIWSGFRFDVEKEGFTNAVISPTDEPKGFIVTTSKSYNFVYVRDASGQWSRLPNKPAQK